jgi:hypothetical protein
MWTGWEEATARTDKQAIIGHVLKIHPHDCQRDWLPWQISFCRRNVDTGLGIAGDSLINSLQFGTWRCGLAGTVLSVILDWIELSSGQTVERKA